MPEEKKRRLPTPLAVLVMCALMAAFSIVLGKYLAINGGEVLRFSFENLPIIFAGIAFGPIAGVVGVVADLLGCLMVGYPINLLVTVGAGLVGVVSGCLSLVFRRLPRFPLILKTVITVLSSHAVGSVVVKTVGLSAFYSMPLGILMLWRLLNYVIIGSLEIVILYFLLRNRSIEGYIKRFRRKKKAEKRSNDKTKMTADEAIRYIHGINWTVCKPGLERIAELCEKLGHPEKELKFIHVAGTNGKGSFSAMTDSILRAAGYKVGLYTSPYIISFGERMRVNGENIPDERLAEITEYVKPIADAMTDKPTEFELITAIAFEYFRRERVDVVILEAGMGGRLDSTNIIEASLLSVITGIALDHTAYLGDTIEKIAAEKAGIIKSGCPVLFGGSHEGARAVIEGRAKELSAPLTVTDYTKLSIESADLGGSTFTYKGGRYKTRMLGLYQPRNASTVLEAVEILRKSGFDVPDEAIATGLDTTRWPARFEKICDKPLVIFDGAHNPEGIDSAVRSIRHYFGEHKVYVLTGVLRDKDYGIIADRLSEVAARAYTITPGNPRALPAREFANVLRHRGLVAVTSSSIKEALSRAMSAGLQDGTPVVVLGSLYTYSSVVEAMNEINEKTPPEADSKNEA